MFTSLKQKENFLCDMVREITLNINFFNLIKINLKDNFFKYQNDLNLNYFFYIYEGVNNLEFNKNDRYRAIKGKY